MARGGSRSAAAAPTQNGQKIAAFGSNITRTADWGKADQGLLGEGVINALEHGVSVAFYATKSGAGVNIWVSCGDDKKSESAFTASDVNLLMDFLAKLQDD